MKVKTAVRILIVVAFCLFSLSSNPASGEVKTSGGVFLHAPFTEVQPQIAAFKLVDFVVGFMGPVVGFAFEQRVENQRDSYFLIVQDKLTGGAIAKMVINVQPTPDRQGSIVRVRHEVSGPMVQAVHELLTHVELTIKNRIGRYNLTLAEWEKLNSPGR